jgi:signal peptidase I
VNRRSSTQAFVRDLVVIVVVAVLASFLIKTFLVRSFYIPSASMESTLLGNAGHHDRILVDELVPGLLPLQRGDVIVFTDPGGWLTGEEAPVAVPSSPVAAAADRVLSLVGLSPQDANDHLVKRVIGLPGDHVACCDALGRVTVNGTPIVEPYTRLPAGTEQESELLFSMTVRPGDLWVMGDNRWNSSDSRYHQQTSTGGGVPIKDVTGPAFVISWPISRWRYLSNYPQTFAGVPATAPTGFN